MKKNDLRISSHFVLAHELPLPTFATEEERGIAFTEDAYKPDTAYETTPNTFETWLYFPANMPASQRGGVIIGNYQDGGACVNFEIHQNGSPRQSAGGRAARATEQHADRCAWCRGRC